MDETGRTADRTVENMIVAANHIAEQIEALISRFEERGTNADAKDALALVETISATFSSLLPK